jgi:tetratricopeptide (TPR) repeat protein
MVFDDDGWDEEDTALFLAINEDIRKEASLREYREKNEDTVIDFEIDSDSDTSDITWSKNQNLRPFEQYVKDYLEGNNKSIPPVSGPDNQTLGYLKYQIVNFLKHEKKEYDERALEYSERALNIDPTCVDVLINRGVAASRLGLFDIAIRSYYLAFKHNPSNDQIYDSIGYVMIKKKKYMVAIELLNEAIEINPNNAGAYNSRSIAWYQIGEYNNAIVDAESCVKLGGPKKFYDFLLKYQS